MNLKEEFKDWSYRNLGKKVGVWYSPYLEVLGKRLEEYGIQPGLKDNFFNYTSYEEFLPVYQQLTTEDDQTVEQILGGSSKRYPETFRVNGLKYRKKVAEEDVKNSIRSNPQNFGGIPNLGATLRSYLKFLYYKDNPEIATPDNIEGSFQIDPNINYWVYHPRFEDLSAYYENNYISIGWDYLKDLNDFNSREEIQTYMIEYEGLNHQPWNNSLAVWDFSRKMKAGDRFYVLRGNKKVIAIGQIAGDYQYDPEFETHKHYRKVEWLEKVEWDLVDGAITGKVLTNFTKYPDWVIRFENRLLEDTTGESNVQEKFREWLGNQRTTEGELIGPDSVDARINTILEIEDDFDTVIFEQSDIEALEELREKVLQRQTEGNYSKHTSNAKTSINSFIRFLKTKPEEVLGVNAYDDDDFLKEVFMERGDLQRLKSLLDRKKNLILRGAPGVGKTYIADRLAYTVMGEEDDSRIHFVQFHQSYSYEEFIEGFRPNTDGKGFSLVTGPFIDFCERAAQDTRPYFFIIDEINRGNMSRIFGELMMLIEADKRGLEISLLYSNKKFSVPSNVYIIGTMNTADRSLAMLDYALRRRFAFYDLQPAFDMESFHSYISGFEDVGMLSRFIERLKALNVRIKDTFGAGFQIGHSYFTDPSLKKDTHNTLFEILEYEIKPQLEEYWFDDLDIVDEEYNRLRECLYEQFE